MPIIISQGQGIYKTSYRLDTFFQFQVGDTYHFDFFIVERKLCTSRIFLETQSIVFIQNDSEEPPMDYFVTLAEDFNVDGIVAELTLSDAFSVGPGYDVITVKGKVDSPPPEN